MSKVKNQCFNFLRELKSGVGYTAPYLLSHHEEKEHYKCIKIKTIFICARCLGVYFGLLASVFLFLINNLFVKENSFFIVAVFPFFALMDWGVTAFSNYKSNNGFRIISGFFLGFAYVQGVLLFFQSKYEILLVALVYGLLAVILIYFRFLFKKG